MPLAACIESRVIVLHGGLFTEDGVTLDDIRAIDRRREEGTSAFIILNFQRSGRHVVMTSGFGRNVNQTPSAHETTSPPTTHLLSCRNLASYRGFDV